MDHAAAGERFRVVQNFPGLGGRSWGTTMDPQMLMAARTYFHADSTFRLCFETILSEVVYRAEFEVTFGAQKRPVRGEFLRVIKQFAAAALKELVINGFFSWRVPKDWRKMMVISPSVGRFEVRIDDKAPARMRFIARQREYDRVKPRRHGSRPLADQRPDRTAKRETEQELGGKLREVTVVEAPEESGQLTSVMGSVLTQCWMVHDMKRENQYANHIRSNPPLVVTDRQNPLNPGSGSIQYITAQATLDMRGEVAQEYAAMQTDMTHFNESLNKDETTQEGTKEIAPNPFCHRFPDPNDRLRGPFSHWKHDLMGKQVEHADMPQLDGHLIDWDSRKREGVSEAFGLPLSIVFPGMAQHASDVTVTQKQLMKTLSSFAEKLSYALSDVLNRALHERDTNDLLRMFHMNRESADAKVSQLELNNPRRYNVQIKLRPQITTDQILAIAADGHLSERKAQDLLFQIHNIPDEYKEGAPGVQAAATARLLIADKRAGVKRERPNEEGGADKSASPKKKQKQKSSEKKEQD